MATALLREPGSNWWPQGYDSHALPTELSRNEKTGATDGFGRRAAYPEGHFLLTVFKTVRCEVTDSYGILYGESKSDGREQSAGPSGLFPLLPVYRLCVPAAAFPDLETK